MRKIYLIFGLILIALPALAQENNGYKNIISQDESLEGANILKDNKDVIELNESISVIGKSRFMKGVESIEASALGHIQTPYILSNYNRYGHIPLSKHLFIYLESDRWINQNLSSYISLHGALGWRINDHISIRGGLLAIKQFSAIHPFATDRSGINFNFNYKLNEKATFNIWGQYITKYNSDELKFSDLLMLKTSTGSSATLKIGKNSQIGMTTEYQVINQANKASYESKGKFQLNF